MKKERAIQLLGGSIPLAAKEIGCSYHAVRQWPEELPPRIEDRVVAALARKDPAISKLLDEPAKAAVNA